MYPVSDAFLEAVKAKTRKYYWTGRITTKNGRVYEFGQDDIVKGSGYITSQCCGTAEIELGSVYAAEMGISLFSDIDRYTLMDGSVELFYHLRVSENGDSADADPEHGQAGDVEPGNEQTAGAGSEQGESGDSEYEQTAEADGIYETVPMGIFEISEANRRVRCLEIKAYDRMLRFEKDFSSMESAGNAYDFMVLCSSACRVALAQSRAEIEAMPNGSVPLSIYPDNDIETYRDVLHYIGQLLGGFFVMNRAGELELRKYGDVPVLNVERKHRFASSFSDFITRYTAVSSTNMRTETAEYYARDPDDGLTMNLEINPFIQFGLRETREQIVRNILADLAVVRYVPFDSDTIGNPALDAGDVLRFCGGQADEDQISCITSDKLRIGGRQSIRCVGKNPRLAQAKSRNDKNISGLLAQVNAGRIGIHTFTNAEAFTVTDADTKIISIEFATIEENHAQFLGQVIVDVSADPERMTGTASGEISVPGQGGDVTVPVELPMEWTAYGHADVIFSFELNGERVPVHCPQERWGSGRHTILLYYPVERVVPNHTNVFSVYMRCSGGRAQVGAGMCIASVSGQSMGAAAAWDGVIEIEEEDVGPFAFGTGAEAGRLSVKSFGEVCSVEMLGRMDSDFADVTDRAVIGGFAMSWDVAGSNA